MSPVRRSLERARPRKTNLTDPIHCDSLVHMYYEDWTANVLPFVYRDSGERFRVTISPENQRSVMRDLLTTHGHSNDSLEESLSEFVKEVSQCLILYDGAAYELCESDDRDRKGLFLDLLSFESLRLEGDEVVQSIEGDNGVIEKRRAARSKVLMIAPPDWIEGGKGFQRTIQDLLSLSRQEFSPMEFFEKQSQGKATAFDYTSFRQYQETEVLRETKQSGWLGRGLYSEKMTEYYYVNRYLRFKRSQIELRDYILALTNDFLGGLESHGIPRVRLAVEGLPSLSDIDLVSRELEAGKISFKETMDKVRF
jgi:hypothetical protein